MVIWETIKICNEKTNCNKKKDRQWLNFSFYNTMLEWWVGKKAEVQHSSV